MKILIAGGSGFIGSSLADHLTHQGHLVTILTRSAKTPKRNPSMLTWDGIRLDISTDFDAIVNLCGENIASKRWTHKVKQRLTKSRLDPTQAIVAFINQQPSEKKPLLINASAIGFYPSATEIQTEDTDITGSSSGFSQQLVKAWESAAKAALEKGGRVSCLRFGVVLGAKGGMLKKLLMPFKLGLGCVMGDKEAYMSWIHIEDLCRALSFLLSKKELKPAYNFTAPTPCTQAEFSQSLSKACKRPCFLHFPRWLIKLLFGEMGQELLLANQKIYPKALEQAGFSFHYQAIDKAIQAIILKHR